MSSSHPSDTNANKNISANLSIKTSPLSDTHNMDLTRPYFPLTLEELYGAIEKELQNLGYSYQKPQALAKCILQASEFYIQKSGVSPWKNPGFMAAYLAHFLPMNILRIQKSLQRLGSDLSPSLKFYDYGCGPMTWLWAYILEYQTLPEQYTYFDLAPEAPRLGLKLFTHLKAHSGLAPHIWSSLQAMTPLKDALARATTSGILGDKALPSSVFCLSYSFNELPEPLKLEILNFPQIYIIEPSMQSTSRRLMQFRDLALHQNFKVLAPCTHLESCPLLLHSKKDWCFDRVTLNMPEMAYHLYQELPFDQKQATYSYLFLCKKTEAISQKSTSFPKPPLDTSRVVGDTQKEKGKQKTLVCRSSQREFFTLLKKQKLDLELHRGDLFSIPENTHTVANEIRIQD